MDMNAPTGRMPLDAKEHDAAATFQSFGDIEIPRDFGDPAAEYRAALTGAAIHDRSYRSLIELTGSDRASWLHNLSTNEVKNLLPGDGNYAFATNVQGRILFDLNVLILDDAIWLDIDRRYIDQAINHFDRYLITEDVQITERTDAFARIGLIGPRAVEIADALGAGNAPAMAALQNATVSLAGKQRRFVRHDFAGVFGIEVFVERDDAVACWDGLIETGATAGLQPVGYEAVDTLRIEAGIPLLGPDIDEDTTPPETGQIKRGISYVKGCYLGQEVIERMRSHDIVPRRLVGLTIADGTEGATGGGDVPKCGAAVQSDGDDVGYAGSACRSPAVGGPIALALVKWAHAAPGTNVMVVAEPCRFSATITELPFRR